MPKKTPNELAASLARLEQGHTSENDSLIKKSLEGNHSCSLSCCKSSLKAIVSFVRPAGNGLLRDYPMAVPTTKIISGASSIIAGIGTGDFTHPTVDKQLLTSKIVGTLGNTMLNGPTVVLDVVASVKTKEKNEKTRWLSRTASILSAGSYMFSLAENGMAFFNTALPNVVKTIQGGLLVTSSALKTTTFILKHDIKESIKSAACTATNLSLALLPYIPGIEQYTNKILTSPFSELGIGSLPIITTLICACLPNQSKSNSPPQVPLSNCHTPEPQNNLPLLS